MHKYVDRGFTSDALDPKSSKSPFMWTLTDPYLTENTMESMFLFPPEAVHCCPALAVRTLAVTALLDGHKSRFPQVPPVGPHGCPLLNKRSLLVAPMAVTQLLTAAGRSAAVQVM